MNCPFRPNHFKKKKWHPPPQMYAYVDESYPHQTHFSIPFTMVVVWKYPFVCAFLKCHFESVWPVSNGLRERFSVGSQAIQLTSQHPLFLFYLVATHLFFLWGSIPLWEVIQYGRFFFFLAIFIYSLVPCFAPARSLWLHLIMTWLSKCLFWSIPSGMYQHAKMGKSGSFNPLFL